jgi:6-phosphofructokinase 1
MKIGVLTGGGDCPGLNPAIRAVVVKSISLGHQITGIRYGWQGLIEVDAIPLDLDSLNGTLERGGTFLKTSRTNPMRIEDGIKTITENMEKLGLDALVAIGGDDTLSVAAELHRNGVKVVGIPKTIDNDLAETDYCIGFDTSINTVVDAIERARTTAESHSRVIIVEVMGRNAGWIAAFAGLAGGADCTLVPEVPFSVDDVCDSLQSRLDSGKDSAIVVVAEGAKPDEIDSLVVRNTEIDAFGHEQLGGIAKYLEKVIAEKVGIQTRSIIVGHIQRGGPPSVFDRILASRLGVKAVELVVDGQFGNMVALKGNQIEPVPLEKAVAHNRTLDLKLYELVQLFSGSRNQ